MTSEHNESEPSRELRLEGAALFVACGALLALLGGSFMAGRWYERRAQPQQVVTHAQSGPLDQVTRTDPPVDTSDNLTFFDEVDGDTLQAEPERQLRPPAPEPERQPQPSAAVEAARSKPPAGGGGSPKPAAKPAAMTEDDPSFYVQVFAGRDRKSAEGLVDKLQTQGYEVRMFTQQEGRDTLFKVRVGGYATKDLARTKAVELQRAGFAGAFVARAG